jgi:Arm DNA-binding domain
MRFTWAGKPNEMGLGGAAVSLAQARDKADAARKLVAAGVNPIEYRRTAKHLRAGKPTFGQCADELLAAKASEWRNEKHKAQWRMTLTEYAKPLRALSVDEVDTEAVLSVLQPMWQSIPCFPASRKDRGGFGRRSGQRTHSEERSQSCPLAWSPRQALAEAPEAHAKPSCGASVPGRSRLHR